MPLLTLAPGDFAVRASEPAKAKPQHYYSDYISFVGSDERGYVYLAHDNNRGQTGDQYFADHWIAMYDDATGWVDIAGSAHYPNREKLLSSIPDSEHFQFSGRAETGLSFNSASNNMALSIEPLPRTLLRENADGVFWVGGAPATFVWKGRKLHGRVLFEYLQRHNWNRFTEAFEANWRNFNGLYLMTSTGADFYVHYHEREGGSDLTGRLVGLASWAVPAPVSNLDFEIASTVAVPWRSYRCPSRWRVDFDHAGRSWRLELFTAERRNIADWTTGGFFMSTVEGRISALKGSEQLDVIGWAELLL